MFKEWYLLSRIDSNTNASLYNLAKKYHFEVNDDLLEEKIKEGRNLSKNIR